MRRPNWFPCLAIADLRPDKRPLKFLPMPPLVQSEIVQVLGLAGFKQVEAGSFRFGLGEKDAILCRVGGWSYVISLEPDGIEISPPNSSDTFFDLTEAVIGALIAVNSQMLLANSIPENHEKHPDGQRFHAPRI
jgi:hypothetical protein